MYPDKVENFVSFFLSRHYCRKNNEKQFFPLLIQLSYLEYWFPSCSRDFLEMTFGPNSID